MKSLRTVFAMIAALVVAVAITATPASAGTLWIENSPLSKTPITVDDYCAGASLGSTTRALYPGNYTYQYDKGFKVPSGHRYSAWRGNTLWINNVMSYGNAVCLTTQNVEVLVTT